MNHRELGRELNLFFFDEHAPGQPFWLPDGVRVLGVLQDLSRRVYEREGYIEIASPMINSDALWKRSGHWQNYRDDMFYLHGEESGLKPMNCPSAMCFFNLRPRSWRELPLRVADWSILHRNEPSGSLMGLMRARKFQQDDAHIFCRQEEVEREIARFLELVEILYAAVNLKPEFRLSLRPKEFVGDPLEWDRAEDLLKNCLAGRAFEESADGGAFYGPKIDVIVWDVAGREWQLGSIQLDYQMPKRFDCRYADRDGKMKCPVVLHRAMMGSVERFLGVLLEKAQGILPWWLASQQVVVLPVNEQFAELSRNLVQMFRDQGIRAELDSRDISLSSRIRLARQLRRPAWIVIGEKEDRDRVFSLEGISGKLGGPLSILDLIPWIRPLIKMPL